MLAVVIGAAELSRKAGQRTAVSNLRRDRPTAGDNGGLAICRDADCKRRLRWADGAGTAERVKVLQSNLHGGRFGYWKIRKSMHNQTIKAHCAKDGKAKQDQSVACGKHPKPSSLRETILRRCAAEIREPEVMIRQVPTTRQLR